MSAKLGCSARAVELIRTRTRALYEQAVCGQDAKWSVNFECKLLSCSKTLPKYTKSTGLSIKLTKKGVGGDGFSFGAVYVHMHVRVQPLQHL